MRLTLIEIVYLLELLAITTVRSMHTSRYRRLRVAEDRKSGLDMLLLALVGVGMLVPLVYLFTSVLDFADYRLPGWTGWAGAVLFAAAIWLLWRSHADLGRNWTPTLGLREGHGLVTGGVFQYLRHPMYAAHLLWAAAIPLMLHNWIAGFAFLVVAAIQYATRVAAEEEMMLAQFGDEYAQYMRRTGRLIPRLGQGGSIDSG